MAMQQEPRTIGGSGISPDIPRKYCLIWYSTSILGSSEIPIENMVEWTREICGFIWFDKALTEEIMVIQWRHMAI